MHTAELITAEVAQAMDSDTLFEAYEAACQAEVMRHEARMHTDDLSPQTDAIERELIARGLL